MGWEYLIAAAIGALGGVVIERIRVNVRLRLEHERRDLEERRKAYRGLIGAAEGMNESFYLPQDYDYDSDSIPAAAQYEAYQGTFDHFAEEITTLALGLCWSRARSSEIVARRGTRRAPKRPSKYCAMQSATTLRPTSDFGLTRLRF